MRILLGVGVPSWASSAFRIVENAITALERKVDGSASPLSPTRLVLPSERSRDPGQPEIRYDTSTKRIEVWDKNTGTWKYVELT